MRLNCRFTHAQLSTTQSNLLLPQLIDRPALLLIRVEFGKRDVLMCYGRVMMRAAAANVMLLLR